MHYRLGCIANALSAWAVTVLLALLISSASLSCFQRQADPTPPPPSISEQSPASVAAESPSESIPEEAAEDGAASDEPEPEPEAAPEATDP